MQFSVAPLLMTVLLFCAPLLAQGPDSDADASLIAKGVAHNRIALGATSAYTCLETIDRGQREANARSFQQLDLVRVEVMKLGNKELFAWPGGSFEDKPLTQFVAGGLIGDGTFGLFADDVFVNGAATMKFRGNEPLRGRPALRVDYAVSSLLGHFTLQTATGKAEVEYRGTYWLDPATFDLLRMDIFVDDIPSPVQLAKISIQIDYETETAGDNRATRTQHSLMEVVTSSGEIHRDEINFTHCRQFAAETKLMTGNADDSAVKVAQTPRQPNALPGDLDIRLQLQNPIDVKTASVGDSIMAIVESDVKDEKRILIPKGAHVSGRIRRLERREGQPGYVLAGLEFSDIAVGEESWRFIARMQSIDVMDGITTEHRDRKEARMVNQPHGVGSGGTIETRISESFDNPLAGVGYLYLSADAVSIPAGLRMRWKSESVVSNKK
ncbi:MAG TPA: hypothetical protein VGM43_01965 [Bryobacteraceae bacterium]|jgi:hypothetical protein